VRCIHSFSHFVDRNTVSTVPQRRADPGENMQSMAAEHSEFVVDGPRVDEGRAANDPPRR
jgi:hypothetical protein